MRRISSLLTSLASHQSAASPTEALIATIYQANLILRSSSNGQILRTISLEASFASRCAHIHWYPGKASPVKPSARMLLADVDTVHVYDALEESYHAKIACASDTGRISHVEFGCSEDEVLVFADFNIKLTIWSLSTSCGVEIRDPKYASLGHFPSRDTGHFHGDCGHSFRAETGHLAILARSETKDVVMVLGENRALEASWATGMVDAKGVKWSPDGRWLVIWEASAVAYLLSIYTADGQLYTNIAPPQPEADLSLGVSGVVWDLDRWLLVAGVGGEVSIYGTKTVTLPLIMNPSNIDSLPSCEFSTIPASYLHQRLAFIRKPCQAHNLEAMPLLPSQLILLSKLSQSHPHLPKMSLRKIPRRRSSLILFCLHIRLILPQSQLPLQRQFGFAIYHPFDLGRSLSIILRFAHYHGIPRLQVFC